MPIIRKRRGRNGAWGALNASLETKLTEQNNYGRTVSFFSLSLSFVPSCCVSWFLFFFFLFFIAAPLHPHSQWKFIMALIGNDDESCLNVPCLSVCCYKSVHSAFVAQHLSLLLQHWFLVEQYWGNWFGVACVCELLPRQMVREAELDDVALLVRTELSLWKRKFFYRI